jgi:hypothetical protein
VKDCIPKLLWGGASIREGKNIVGVVRFISCMMVYFVRAVV